MGYSPPPPPAAVNLINPTANQPYILNEKEMVELSKEAKKKTRMAQVMGITLLIAMLFIIWLIFFVII